MRVIPAVAVLAVVLAAGPAVAQTGLTVALKFSPQGSSADNAVALSPSLLAQAIGLRVTDGREAPDLLVLGAGTDDDDRPFPIRSDIEVPPFVEQVVRQLADAHRVQRESTAPRQLQLRLTRFRVDESNKAVGSTYSAQVHFAYAMTDRTGAVLAEGAVVGTANRYGRARSGANCAEVLSDALREAFAKVLADTSLQAAWRSGTATRSTTPPPAKESIEQRLRQIDDLLKKGLITPEEYKQKRAEILKDA
ncbi:MAG: SHOCT domain-containing protein [Acidobacteriota bacterium]